MILQTTLVKAAAMLSLFDVDRATKQRIETYILANGGVRRDHKIAHILRTFLGVADPGPALPRYLAKYAGTLDAALARAPLVPGVERFLASAGFTFHVSSSAPDDEVRQQLRSRGLLSCFASISGASTPKADALMQVRATTSGELPVFFGDALGDWAAARAAAVPFVGLVHERDNFEDLHVVKLRDFSSPTIVHDCIATARLR
ncbi:hypothetical protein [Ramlibacter algicola]|uniref:phosphoglycolate phosphatase n=1 Tax=Ramlibacter algicola TaxID=2795217 RepID=A0A934Q053_9BURK|nr:hypothetical protein [Ramlibacter algicola]MBK0392341.1 hypothetical protein [Ramlibacter algicola]